MKIETTLVAMMADSNHDWAEVFRYAGKEATLRGMQPPPEPVLGFTGGTEPFGMSDVEELLGSVDGEHDVSEWVCIGKLKDGRYFTIEAGCDYTGWDCWASGRAHVGGDLASVLALGLDEDARRRLEA